MDSADEELRCQSCGMPLGEFPHKDGKTADNFGASTDGTPNTEYCAFCFQRGAFTRPDLTLEGMSGFSVARMTGELKMSEPQARELAARVIPKLKRWQTAAG